MLSSSHRIRRLYLKEIFRKGRSFHGKDLSLFAVKDPIIAPKHSLFSFSASKKVSKIAPKRNKLRRQGYSIVKTLLINISPGFLCVFTYKPSAIKASFSDLKGQIENLLKEAKIIAR